MMEKGWDGTMKSYAVLEDGSCRTVEIPTPEPGPYEALVRIEACGVCNGTDSKMIHRTFKGFDQYPALLGHEAVGKVVRLGNRVRHLALGDRVLLPFGRDCEVNGVRYASGWGGFSQYGTVGDARAIEEDGLGPDSPYWSEGHYGQISLPSDLEISPGDATMIVTFREVLAAIRNFGMVPGNSVVIFGAGPVGLTFTRLLTLSGVTDTVVFDLNPEKARRAVRFGAGQGYSSRETDPVAAVRALYPQGVDFVLDAVGVSSLMNTAMEIIADHGKICCYGISPRTDFALDWSKAPYNWQLQFEQFPSKIQEGAVHGEILSWIREGRLRPADFITARLPFDRIDEAFQMIEERRTDLKTVILFEDGLD